ncbi:MAG TPA: PP2C family protein-serine/threonine phosphatase, partial [Spirochaetota bacterium]|nr:PP2C family protein-serine/threonine phosphatase [Spirochaetota bacterium]
EFYDIFYFDGALGFSLGDIHARGIPGSLKASVVNGAIKAYASVRGQSPRYMHTRIDSLIKDNIDSVNTLSLFYGVISFEDNMLRFINSGVAYPVFVRNGTPRYVKIGGSSLGEGDLDLKKVKINLRPGDLFVIVTDGLIKQKNRNAQQMGLKRVVDFLGKEFDKPEDVVDALMDFADDFTGGLEKKEDITIIAMKINQHPL